MARAVEPNELLDRLAQKFEDAEQTSPDVPNGHGWGQFLDAPKRHKQIGLYGTSAGALVLALAGRGQSALLRQAGNLLGHWWAHAHEQDEYGHERLVQIPRLAFLNLALRLSGVLDRDGIRKEVEDALFQRRLPSGLWGNYWISGSLQDPTPRLFPSAVALLSFTLLRDASVPAEERFIGIADLLEDRLDASSDLPLLHAAVAAAAILAAKGGSIRRRTRARLIEMALSSDQNLEESGVYFYDYEYSPDQEEQTLFGRDYFIAPTEVLLAISGFQSGAPNQLRLRAEAAFGALAENVHESGGAYRPSLEHRVSSVNQAWAALLAKAYSREHNPPGRVARFVYGLRRQRRGNWVAEKGFPALAMVAVTIGNVLVEDAGLVAKVVASAAVLVIGGLYGAKALGRLFPGRK